MKNVLHEKSRTDLFKRIERLNIESKALWGKMNSAEMICHCADQIKMSTGDIKTRFVGNPFTKTVLKQLILAGMPAPKGKVETVKELKQGALGTKPTVFENDIDTLKNLVLNFGSNYRKATDIVHPAFGKMNKKQWGRLIYIHLDHHLRQFGV